MISQIIYIICSFVYCVVIWDAIRARKRNSRLLDEKITELLLLQRICREQEDRLREHAREAERVRRTVVNELAGQPSASGIVGTLGLPGMSVGASLGTAVTQTDPSFISFSFGSGEGYRDGSDRGVRAEPEFKEELKGDRAIQL